MSDSDGGSLRAFNVRTGPFPGFPTDLQPQATALLSTCNGFSIVEEFVFEQRMSHGMLSILLCAKNIP